jgi:hypothetical protein
MDKTTYNPS